MLQASQLLETPTIITANVCQSEIDADWQLMIQRQRLTQQLLDHQIDWEYYFDWMIQHGYEPEELIDTAQQNLDWAISQGIEIEI